MEFFLRTARVKNIPMTEPRRRWPAGTVCITIAAKADASIQNVAARQLNWAITGWHRLISFGHFTQPKSALEAVQQLEVLGSPTGAFIREKCEIGAGHTATIDQLFGAWCQWCQEQGRDKPGTKQTFGRDLRAACPGLKVTQPRHGDERERAYQGIRIKY